MKAQRLLALCASLLGILAVVGKQVRVTEILIHRISSGKVVEGWMGFDQLGLWRQLGAIPPLVEDEG